MEYIVYDELAHQRTFLVARKGRGIGRPPVFDTVWCTSTVFDYIYGTWYRCRHCGYWEERVPE